METVWERALHLIGLRQETLSSCCERGNETLVPMQGGEIYNSFSAETL